MDFASLLSAAKTAADADQAARQKAVRDALAAAEGTPDLAALERAAAEEFAKLTADDAALDENVFAELGLIADVVDAVRAEGADQQAARVAELANRVGQPTLPASPAKATAPAEPAPAEPAKPPAPAEPAPAPAEPAKQPEPDTRPAEPQPGDPAPQSPGQPAAEPAKELVVAAGRPLAQPQTRVRNTVPLSSLPVQTPGTESGASPFAITAAADLPGFNLGQELDPVEGLTRAVMARFGQLSRAGGDAGGSRAGIASVNIDRDERLVAHTQHDWQVIEYACDERRLPGGSLLAAGTPGWCAGCEVSFDFCPPVTVDGLVDIPSVTARRGCLTYPVSPDFSTIYSGTGWAYTPAQIDNMQLPVHPTWDGTGAEPAGGPWYNPTVGPSQKDCYKIECPPTTDVVLEPVGMCLQASILHERAYPELIRYVVDQALAAQAHRMNCRILSQMSAQSDLVDLTANGNLGPGATAVMLEAIEMQVEWLRYRYRLGMATTMEMVAPAWMRGILRADLSKRMGVDLINVDNATLDRYLRDRGVRVQWVLDWQDAFCDPTPAAPPANPVTASDLFGGNGSRSAWPLTGEVLIYPAGTFFLARMDIINLEAGLLDSTLLRRNERMVLFTEEAMAVGKKCYTASRLRFNLCPSGQTGSGKAIACAATVGA